MVKVFFNDFSWWLKPSVTWCFPSLVYKVVNSCDDFSDPSNRCYIVSQINICGNFNDTSDRVSQINTFDDFSDTSNSLSQINTCGDFSDSSCHIPWSPCGCRSVCPCLWGKCSQWCCCHRFVRVSWQQSVLYGYDVVLLLYFSDILVFNLLFSFFDWDLPLLRTILLNCDT